MVPAFLNEHFDNPYHRGECPSTSHAAELTDSDFGCILVIELLIQDGTVAEGWFDGSGCACCEGLASLLMERIESETVAAVNELRLSDILADSSSLTELPACKHLPLSVLKLALKSPIDAIDHPHGFSGPSLREEC